MDTKAYDDFEPFCKWETENTYDTLKVYLQGKYHIDFCLLFF